MNLNTQIGRRIWRNDVTIEGLDREYEKIPIVSFTRLGSNDYLTYEDAYGYIQDRAVQIISDHGGFDQNLVKGICSGSIKPKKAYIPIYLMMGYYTHDTTSTGSYYAYYSESQKKMVTDKSRSSANEHYSQAKGKDEANVFKWYVPNSYGGLIDEKSFHSLNYSMITLCNNEVENFRTKEYRFYNEMGVTSGMSGAKSFIESAVSQEMRNGVHRKDHPCNPHYCYEPYLFEIVVYEYSSGNNAPAFVAINVFDPSCYTFRKTQGGNNPDYTGRLDEQAKANAKKQASSGSANSSAPAAQAQPAKPRESAMALVGLTESKPYYTVPSPEEEKRLSKIALEKWIAEKEEKKNAATAKVVYKRHMIITVLFYVIYTAMLLAAAIVGGARAFYFAFLLFGVVYAVRIPILIKYGIIKKSDTRLVMEDFHFNTKKILLPDLLLFFGGIAHSIFSLIIVKALANVL